MGYDIDECSICYLNGFGNNSVREYQTMSLCVICFGKAVGMRTGGSSMRRTGRLPSEFNQDRSFKDVKCYCNRHDDDIYQLGFNFPCCRGCKERIMEEIDEELGPLSPPTSDDDDSNEDHEVNVDDNANHVNNDEDIDGDHKDDLIIIPVAEQMSSKTE